MAEEELELETVEEAPEEEAEEEEVPKAEVAPAAAGLKIILENPKISIQKLILRKKE